MNTVLQPDTEELIDLTARGDAAARQQLLVRHRKKLVKMVAVRLDRRVAARVDPSDVVQEAFLEAAHGFERFHGDSEAQLRAWLRVLLRRRISKLLRRYRNTLKRRTGLETRCDPDAGRVERRNVAADVPTPSAQVMQGEQAQALHLVLDRLPEDYRQVLRFRYEEQRSFEEIGTLMQRSGNAARLLWLRAVDRVKQELNLSDG